MMRDKWEVPLCPNHIHDITVAYGAHVSDLWHILLWQLYIENQKRIPNFWMYDAFLIDKQLFIWGIVQNRYPFL